MWWQGEDFMLEIVNICYRSVCEYAGNHDVRLITKESYKEYIRNYEIEMCMTNGKISLAYFSDIMRCYLLYTYGGIWLDATLLLTSPIDEFIGNSSFYTGRRLDVSDNYFVAQGKWTSYLCGGIKGNQFYLYMMRMLVEHLQKEEKIIDYFMADYFFTLAYENFPFVKRMLELVSPVPALLGKMMSNMNNTFDEVEYECLIRKIPFHKLTYKMLLREKTNSDRMTYYGFLKKRFL